MSRKLLITAAVFGCISLRAQTVSVELEEKEFEVGEKIELRFSTDFKVDSIKPPHFKDFQIISGPSTSRSVSVKNGEYNYTASQSFVLKAKAPGKFKLSSGEFFSNGRAYTSRAVTLIVTGEPLNQDQLEKHRFETFRESRKPEGSIRYIFYEDFGYIEQHNGFEWIFLRRLTPEEIELLQDMK